MITQTLMDRDEIRVPIIPDAPVSFWRDVDPRYYLWASIVVLAGQFDPDDLSDDDLFGLARFHGVYLGQGKDRDGLEGDGCEWWLGNSGDGGNLYVGDDQTVTGNDFEAHLDANFFPFINGMAKGDVATNATTFALRLEGGDSRREILDTLCALAPGGPYYWRLDPNYTIHAHTQNHLWPTTNDPDQRIVLADEAGTDGDTPGIRAVFTVDGLNGREVRTGIYVDWDDDTTHHGTNFPTLPSTYANPVGGPPRVRHYMDWRPKRPKPPTERWRKLAAWQVASDDRADDIAAREAAERSAVRPEITAEIEEYDPWRYPITPGNTVWLLKPDDGLYDLANEVEYRAEATHPTTGRVDQLTTPLQEGYTVVFRRFNGSAFERVNVSPFVAWEEASTTLHIGTRARFPLGRVAAHHLTRRERRRYYRQAHRNKKLARYFDAVRRQR